MAGDVGPGKRRDQPRRDPVGPDNDGTPDGGGGEGRVVTIRKASIPFGHLGSEARARLRRSQGLRLQREGWTSSFQYS